MFEKDAEDGTIIATKAHGGSMKKMASDSQIEPIKVTEEKDGCFLNLSADGKWMRLNVSGKLIAAFHVEYVQKVLGTSEKTSKAKKSATHHDASASL